MSSAASIVDVEARPAALPTLLLGGAAVLGGVGTAAYRADPAVDAPSD